MCLKRHPDRTVGAVEAQAYALARAIGVKD
jgi:hypothetical protein